MLFYYIFLSLSFLPGTLGFHIKTAHKIKGRGNKWKIIPTPSWKMKNINHSPTCLYITAASHYFCLLTTVQCLHHSTKHWGNCCCDLNWTETWIELSWTELDMTYESSLLCWDLPLRKLRWLSKIWTTSLTQALPISGEEACIWKRTTLPSGLRDVSTKRASSPSTLGSTPRQLTWNIHIRLVSAH